MENGVDPGTGHQPGMHLRDAIDGILDQWRRERPDLDPTPIAVFGRLARVQALAQRLLRRQLAHHDLTPATFDVLANLRRSGAPHRKTAGELAASSLLSTGGTSFRLDRLEERQLVRRVTADYDRRVTMVELTPAGLELIDRVMAEHLGLEAELLAFLDPVALAELSDTLRLLERSVALRGGADVEY